MDHLARIDGKSRQLLKVMSFLTLLLLIISGAALPAYATSAALTPTPTVQAKEPEKIAFAAFETRGFGLYTINGDGTKLRRLSSDTHAYGRPEWSPDGKSLVYVSGRGGHDNLYKISIDDGDEQMLTDSGSAFYPHWSPDGKFISFVSAESGTANVYRINADGSDKRDLTASLPPSKTAENTSSWSPDGSKILFTAHNNQSTDNEANLLYMMDADGSNIQQFTHVPQHLSEPAWSLDGSRIVLSSSESTQLSIYTVKSDDSDLRAVSPNDGMKGVAVGGTSWSPDGSHICVSTLNKNHFGFYVTNADGSNVINLTTFQKNDYSPRWSPDSTRLAYISQTDANHRDLYIIDADGSNRHQLTHNLSLDFEPVWAPATP